MSDTRVEEFINLVAKDYIYYLYKKFEDFPYCCHLAANQIASYLYVHFDDTFQHRHKIVGLQGNHGWTSNEKFMIDFTGWQLNNLSIELKNVLKSEDKSLKKAELNKIIQNKMVNEFKLIKYAYDEEYQFYNSNIISELQTSKLYGRDYAKYIVNPSTKEGFMSYVKISFKHIKTTTENAGLYR